MRLPSAGLQTALYELLTGALDCPVYDEVPQNEPFPYCTLGEENSSSYGTKPRPGTEIYLTVWIWGQGRGYLAIKQLADAAVQAITETNIDVPGFEVALVQFTRARFDRAEDGLTRYAELQFQFKVMQGLLPIL
jgi:hypothetical protein